MYTKTKKITHFIPYLILHKFKYCILNMLTYVHSSQQNSWYSSTLLVHKMTPLQQHWHVLNITCTGLSLICSSCKNIFSNRKIWWDIMLSTNTDWKVQVYLYPLWQYLINLQINSRCPPALVFIHYNVIKK